MKTVIFTQGSNIDGVSCAMLVMMSIGEDCDVVFTSQETINDDFIKYFDIEPSYDDDEDIDTYNITGNDKIKEFDKIFITDVCITDELLRRFGRAANVNNKLRMFDHHDIAFQKGVVHYRLNADIQKESNDGPCCSVGLFYEYLIRKGYANGNRAFSDYIKLVRDCDIEKIEDSVDAQNLQYLFDALEHKEFVNLVGNNLLNSSNEKYVFSEEEKNIIEQYKLKTEQEKEQN